MMKRSVIWRKYSIDAECKLRLFGCPWPLYCYLIEVYSLVAIKRIIWFGHPFPLPAERAQTQILVMVHHLLLSHEHPIWPGPRSQFILATTAMLIVWYETLRTAGRPLQFACNQFNTKRWVIITLIPRDCVSSLHSLYGLMARLFMD